VNEKLAVLATRQGGVFSRQDALNCGYSTSQIRAMVGSEAWRRLCRGLYTTMTIEKDLPPWEKGTREHRLATSAALRSLTGDVVVSHQSAVVDYNLPTWGLDLTRVHVTRRDNVGGRVTSGVVQHNSQLPTGSVWLRDGRHVVAPARAIIEVACTSGYEPALVIADQALRTGVVSLRALEFALCDAEYWPHSPWAKQVLAFCSALSESVGESRLRMLMDHHGLPTPILQAPILRDGVPFAWVDFLIAEFSTVVEFDGLMKYGDASVLVREKRREDDIRELGYQVVRVIWSDLDRPARTAERIRQACARGA
jgi:hypothetical protein